MVRALLDEVEDLGELVGGALGPIPALEIPVRVDLDPLKQPLGDLGHRVRGVRAVEEQFERFDVPVADRVDGDQPLGEPPAPVDHVGPLHLVDVDLGAPVVGEADVTVPGEAHPRRVLD